MSNLYPPHNEHVEGEEKEAEEANPSVVQIPKDAHEVASTPDDSPKPSERAPLTNPVENLSERVDSSGEQTETDEDEGSPLSRERKGKERLQESFMNLLDEMNSRGGSSGSDRGSGRHWRPSFNASNFTSESTPGTSRAPTFNPGYRPEYSYQNSTPGQYGRLPSEDSSDPDAFLKMLNASFRKSANEMSDEMRASFIMHQVAEAFRDKELRELYEDVKWRIIIAFLMIFLSSLCRRLAFLEPLQDQLCLIVAVSTIFLRTSVQSIKPKDPIGFSIPSFFLLLVGVLISPLASYYFGPVLTRAAESADMTLKVLPIVLHAFWKNYAINKEANERQRQAKDKSPDETTAKKKSDNPQTC